LKQEELDLKLQKELILKMEKQSELTKLLIEFNSEWKPQREGEKEISWNLKFDGDSTTENFSKEKLEAFQDYLKSKRYEIELRDDKVVGVSDPQKINVQHNYVLDIYRRFKGGGC